MSKKEHQPISYYNEISLMMFGFGDSHKPNPETVRLVESITLQQLRLIIQEATQYITNTNELNKNMKNLQAVEELTGKHLIFLMRKNKYKMRRFIKYLQNKEIRKAAQSNFNPENDALKDINAKSLLEFIESIDETGELTDMTEFDEVKYERMVRADRISIALNEENYIKFYKARCTSFMSKSMSQARNLERLQLWIDPEKELLYSKCALDVLNYFAYETVAQITDYALLVRLDRNRKNDPLANLQGTHFSASMFNGDHRFSGQNPDYSRVYSGQPPISVNEIREVMRRVCSPQAGKLNFGKKLPETQFILAL